MNKHYLSIASEIRELDELLTAMPVENVIDRIGLEARRQRLKKTLETTPKPQVSPKIRLTFKGVPVVGNHAINADFATKAAGYFSDAYAAIAVKDSADLRDVGPIPHRDKNALLITGTAMGSFGFEFEVSSSTQKDIFEESEPTEAAIHKLEKLFRLTIDGSDDDIAELIDEVHPRAVKKVYEFLEYLDKQQAWCGLEFGNTVFRYTSFEELKNSYVRLRDENIKEEDKRFRGELFGVLPSSRTFEFKLLENNEIIRGKIDPSIPDPTVLNHEWLHKPVTLVLGIVIVGSASPRYTLKSLDSLKLEA